MGRSLTGADHAECKGMIVLDEGDHIVDLDPAAQFIGLGLFLVRRIVEKLGGQVGVETAVGEGSRFYFTLPAADGGGGQDRGRS